MIRLNLSGGPESILAVDRVCVSYEGMLKSKMPFGETGMRGQLGRAVKGIDSKSIGVTSVSSSLTAVDVIVSGSCLPTRFSEDCLGSCVLLQHEHLDPGDSFVL